MNHFVFQVAVHARHIPVAQLIMMSMYCSLSICLQYIHNPYQYLGHTVFFVISRYVWQKDLLYKSINPVLNPLSHFVPKCI